MVVCTWGSPEVGRASVLLNLPGAPFDLAFKTFTPLFSIKMILPRIMYKVVLFEIWILCDPVLVMEMLHEEIERHS